MRICGGDTKSDRVAIFLGHGCSRLSNIAIDLRRNVLHRVLFRKKTARWIRMGTRCPDDFEAIRTSAEGWI